MCGLSGVIRGGSLNVMDNNYAKYVEQSLYVNALRGPHSTGLFTVTGNGRVDSAKDVVEPRLFLLQERHQAIIKRVESGTRAAICHNRWATIGGKGFAAAHPHVYGDITLVHNGTLKDYHWMPAPDGVTNDSARLCAQLAQDEPGGLDTLSKLRGAYALIWHDARVNCMYMTRNGERPLYTVSSKGSFFFASELHMLSWMVNRNDLMEKDAKYREFPIHKLHTFDMTQSVVNPIVEAYEPPPEPVIITSPPREVGGHVASFQLNSKRAKKVNQQFAKRGLSLKVGDTLEVWIGGFKPYVAHGNFGMVEGYFTDQSQYTNSKVAAGMTLWADVHQVQNWGKWKQQDTVLAVVKGLSPQSTDEEVVLLCEFKSHGMHREAWEWTDPLFKEFFEEERWRYGAGDSARFRVGKFLLTAREADLWAEGKQCAKCEAPSEALPTGDTCYNADGSAFVCRDCFEAGSEHSKGVYYNADGKVVSTETTNSKAVVSH